jgi:hypothetical protein
MALGAWRGRYWQRFRDRAPAVCAVCKERIPLGGRRTVANSFLVAETTVVLRSIVSEMRPEVRARIDPAFLAQVRGFVEEREELAAGLHDYGHKVWGARPRFAAAGRWLNTAHDVAA